MLQRGPRGAQTAQRQPVQEGELWPLLLLHGQQELQHGPSAEPAGPPAVVATAPRPHAAGGRRRGTANLPGCCWPTNLLPLLPLLSCAAMEGAEELGKVQLLQQVGPVGLRCFAYCEKCRQPAAAEPSRLLQLQVPMQPSPAEQDSEGLQQENARLQQDLASLHDRFDNYKAAVQKLKAWSQASSNVGCLRRQRHSACALTFLRSWRLSLIHLPALCPQHCAERAAAEE